ncbi:MAG: minichromosome maintenance protein MCM [Hadesarchaea archaeon]|nr:minichromosome maintenance protein MCM [Hadesarchaea archaeon]
MDPSIREKLEEFLHGKDTMKELRKLAAKGQKSLVIEFDRLLEYDMALARALLESPHEFLESADAILKDITKLPSMHLRVKGLDSTIPIREIRAAHVGKFIQVEGILTRVSEVKPEIREAVFKCLRCGEENRVLQIDEVFREPLVCENPNCSRKGPFKLEVESSEFLDWQSIRVQERPEELRGGRMPRQLDGIIKDDFVDRAVPGNHVIISGILRVFQEGMYRQRKTTFRKILFVNHIEVVQKGVEEAELSPEDEAHIRELAKDPWLRNLIVQSIAPSIYGYEPIKEAIALQLFGCSPIELPDNTRRRGDIHILLTGDPGTAKSEILKWVAQIAPRGIYTSGKKATGAGLTAAAVRDEIGGGWTLEAGALVIADGGLACIDEFDKMSDEDASAILESMEQQTISVAKAGIVATLNTRTAILAAANPALGRFDKYRSLAEQINLPPVILSRFDLIFIMRDEPAAERDRIIARHILELHHEPTRVVKPPLDMDTLRKLIIYARKYLDPKFESNEPLKVIEDFFVEWRKVAEKGDMPIPITARQLEALIRLTKANARMRLSDRITVEDANRAIRLMKMSLHEAGIDPETGRVDIDVLMTGKSRSMREKLERVLEIIKDLEAEYDGAAPIQEVKRLAAQEGIRESFVDEMIDKEKMRGHLYEPKPGMISRAVR